MIDTVEFIQNLDALTASVLIPLICLYIGLGVDDALLDLYAWLKGFHAGRIPYLKTRPLRRKRQKRIAIAVAAWREHDVIARMVRGNVAQLKYSNYSFFVGVYPNDELTLQAVGSLSQEISNVHIIVNALPGPTSKGQMLNQVVREIVSRRTKSGDPEYDCILVHDSEDIIHPDALLGINSAMDEADFVQVPVFSLAVEHHQWVAGIYMDEFAEVHTKDIRVRNELTGCFPAAGVGMALSRSLAERCLLSQSGRVFNESSLTEDYELGLSTKALGGRSRFLCMRVPDKKERQTLLATREYFPKKLKRSIKQKTRWTVGIAFQGWQKLGWKGSFWDIYFLYRDRKGPWANMAVFVGAVFWIYAVSRWLVSDVQLITEEAQWRYGIFVTSALMANRIFQKTYACAIVYGWLAALGVPLRTILANFINASASFLALKQFMFSRVRGVQLKWVKTEHELPEGFGAPTAASAAEGRLEPASGGRFFASFILALIFAQQPFGAEARAQNATRDERFKCVHVYFDATRDPSFVMSSYHAIFLENLLGHFPQFQAIVEPIENYQAGDIERCGTTFYLGSHFNAEIPDAFFADFAESETNVVWMGYSIWRYPNEKLEEILGLRYEHYLTTLNWSLLDSKQRPTFYKEIEYKGEVFSKYGEFANANKVEFRAPFEMAAVKNVDKNAEVLAWARHNGTGDKLPYAVRKGRRYYVTEVPFGFMHESDRYLVFADLLFDMLQAKPRQTNFRPAVFRFEDIHARVPRYQITAISKVARDYQIPLHIALIPIFRDPLYQMNRAPGEDFIPMHTDPGFMAAIQRLKEQETVFLWHGVTHQHGTIRNPHTAASGDDFEFWDILNNRALPEDSVNWVLDRLNEGWYSLERSGIKPEIWEVPHYQASGLDYSIFARVFPWNIGRVIYRPMSRQNYPTHDPTYWFSSTGLSGDERRKSDFKNLQVEPLAPPTGQFFPYEIYGDVYGQNVLPENLGNPQPYVNSHVSAPRSVDDILRDARRNLKLRDVWGSFFVHPQLVDTRERDGLGDFPGDTKELERLVREMKAMGYEFINLETFISDKKNIRKPPTIYVPLRGHAP